ncbi:MAG TPA: hypothetical protein VFT72_03665 [Opitutaceae bacterium]|nr:hypothetical protein [Opitutaceae bacterium]
MLAEFMVFVRTMRLVTLAMFAASRTFFAARRTFAVSVASLLLSASGFFRATTVTGLAGFSRGALVAGAMRFIRFAFVTSTTGAASLASALMSALG